MKGGLFGIMCANLRLSQEVLPAAGLLELRSLVLSHGEMGFGFASRSWHQNRKKKNHADR